MKYYIVSEEELKATLRAKTRVVTYDSNYDGDSYEERCEALEQAEAACRARLVPEWATHVIGPDDGAVPALTLPPWWNRMEVKYE